MEAAVEAVDGELASHARVEVIPVGGSVAIQIRETAVAIDIHPRRDAEGSDPPRLLGIGDGHEPIGENQRDVGYLDAKQVGNIARATDGCHSDEGRERVVLIQIQGILGGARVIGVGVGAPGGATTVVPEAGHIPHLQETTPALLLARRPEAIGVVSGLDGVVDLHEGGELPVRAARYARLLPLVVVVRREGHRPGGPPVREVRRGPELAVCVVDPSH